MRTIDEKRKIAKNLKYLRKKNGLTIKAFSNLVGIPKGTYSVFEIYGERIGPERLDRIYAFYNIDEVTSLMNHEDFIKRFET